MGFHRNILPLTAEEIMDRVSTMEIRMERHEGQSWMHFEISGFTDSDDDGDGQPLVTTNRPIDAEFLKRLIDAFGR